jgi:hypothetical protein
MVLFSGIGHEPCAVIQYCWAKAADGNAIKNNADIAYFFISTFLFFNAVYKVFFPIYAIINFCEKSVFRFVF